MESFSARFCGACGAGRSADDYTPEFNKLAREGTVGQTIGKILEETKPESIYFTGNRYGRGAIAVFDIEDSSFLPRVAEPWFLIFNAEIEYGPAITPEDLMKAGLAEIVTKWS